MKKKNTIKAVLAAFLITLCVVGTVGGFAVVHDTATANSMTFPNHTQKMEDEEERLWLGLPPRWQALLMVTRLEEWLWERYFTLLGQTRTLAKL